jgi:PBP1b-binding outer membrane lipoprotein LpoB
MKKISLVLVGILIAMLFDGCSITPKETYISYKSYPKVKTTQKVTSIKPLHVEKEISGIIKGKISNLYYDSKKALYRYEVKSTDASNGKLAFAKFTHVANIAKIGDMVYVFIEKGKLKEFYLLQKSNYIKKPKMKTKRKKKKLTIYKRGKHNKSKINAPTSEIILLN